jgi:hypothetical protein
MAASASTETASRRRTLSGSSSGPRRAHFHPADQAASLTKPPEPMDARLHVRHSPPEAPAIPRPRRRRGVGSRQDGHIVRGVTRHPRVPPRGGPPPWWSHHP